MDFFLNDLHKFTNTIPKKVPDQETLQGAKPWWSSLLDVFYSEMSGGMVLLLCQKE